MCNCFDQYSKLLLTHWCTDPREQIKILPVLNFHQVQSLTR